MSCPGCVEEKCRADCPRRNKNRKGKGNERPGQALISEPRDVTYIYDGGIMGFFSCVYESVYQRELPLTIVPSGEAQPSLLPQKFIVTEPGQARRVRDSIPKRISPRALELVENIFLSCMPQKEIALLRFLLLGYRVGYQVPLMLGHADVAPLLAAEKHLLGECHLLRGFIRFSDYDGVLAATISPKNFVLPFIANHFVCRFSNEDFMIFDKTHKAVLIYQDRKKQIIPLEQVDFPEADEKEERYRAMWKRFYKTVAIESRENPRCRMTHMPKRYWENMTEMREFL